MMVVACGGMPKSTKTLVMPSTIFFLFSKVIPDQIVTCTMGNKITYKIGNIEGIKFLAVEVSNQKKNEKEI